MSTSERSYDVDSEFAWASKLLAADPTSLAPRLPDGFHHTSKSSMERRMLKESQLLQQWEEAVADASQRGWLASVSTIPAESSSKRKRGPRSSPGVGAAVRETKWVWQCPSCIAQMGQSLAGRRVSVWWADDAAAYEGHINAFDVLSKRHRVLYDDGEWEFLSLPSEPVLMNLVDDGRQPASSVPGKPGNASTTSSRGAPAVTVYESSSSNVSEAAGGLDKSSGGGSARSSPRSSKNSK